MSDDEKSFVTSPALDWCRVALVALWALVPTFGQMASAATAAQVTLQVEASHGLPGLHHSALARFIAAHMAEAGLADWRFEAAAANAAIAADRVEWTFRLNPYAGGEVRNFAHSLADEWRFGVHRPITIEARLYLNGEYQTLVEKQAVIQGGADDPDLAAAVESITQNLLGPTGAYRAIDSRQNRGDRAR
jgi:hypothetical protein